VPQLTSGFLASTFKDQVNLNSKWHTTRCAGNLRAWQPAVSDHFVDAATKAPPLGRGAAGQYPLNTAGQYDQYPTGSQGPARRSRTRCIRWDSGSELMINLTFQEPKECVGMARVFGNRDADARSDSPASARGPAPGAARGQHSPVGVI
jgi:hypothetical protein